MVLAELEKIDGATDTFGVQIVKINDKRAAKIQGVEAFPTLVYYRNKEPASFDGDLENEEQVRRTFTFTFTFTFIIGNGWVAPW